MRWFTRTQTKSTKQPKRTKRVPRTLTMESLESRQLMAGGITASVVNGSLFINEAPGQTGLDNGVRIAQLANGKVRVEGTPAAHDNGTVNSTVNDAAFQDFTVTGSLFVSLGAGNELVQIGFSDGSGAPSFDEMHINVGTPQPVVQAKTFATTRASLIASPTILNGPDDDQVMVWTGTTRGSMFINTGPGQDWAFLGTVDIGDNAAVDKVVINTGASNDQVTMMGTRVHGKVDIQTYSSLSETSQDGVYFDFNLGAERAMVVDGTTDVRMGGGDDNFYVTDQVDLSLPNELVDLALETKGSLIVDMGAGNDDAFVRSAKIGDGASDNFVLKMGAGADDAKFRNVHVKGSFNLQMYNSFDLQTMMYNPLSEADVDTVLLEDFSAGLDLSVGTGGGADIIRLDDAVAFRDLNIDAGAGNDRLDLVDHVIGVGFVKLLGGDGIDMLKKTSKTGQIDLQTGWEYINGIPQFGTATMG